MKSRFLLLVTLAIHCGTSIPSNIDNDTQKIYESRKHPFIEKQVKEAQEDLKRANPSPYSIITQGSAEELIQLFLSHDFNPKNPLWLPSAVIHGNKDSVSMLLDHGADPNFSLILYPLDIAIFYGYLEIIELLLEHGTDPNYKAVMYYSGLHIACEDGSQEIVALLLKYGADKSKKTSKGETPLKIAKRNCFKNIVTLLETHKSSTSDPAK